MFIPAETLQNYLLPIPPRVAEVGVPVRDDVVAHAEANAQAASATVLLTALEATARESACACAAAAARINSSDFLD